MNQKETLSNFQLRIITAIVEATFSKVDSKTFFNNRLMSVIIRSMFKQISDKKFPLSVDFIKTSNGKIITTEGIINSEEFVGNKANLIDIDFELPNY